jgi:hypothetical protein
MVVLSAMGGCGAGGSGPTIPPDTGRPTTTTTPTAAAIQYTAPPDLCKVIALAAMTEVYPTTGKPQSYTSDNKRSQFCTLALLSSTTTVSFTLHVDYNPNARGVAEAFKLTHDEMGSAEKLTDAPGLGSGAFWFVDVDRSYLELYDGNLDLNIRCATVSSGHTLPADLGERLVRVAGGTLAALRG